MPFCPNCKGAVDESDRYCPHCRFVQPGAHFTGSGVTPRAFGVTGSSGRDRLLERLRRATDGRFEILRRLEHGGMAAVYLARDQRLDRQVAIKVMLPELELADGMTEKFWEEARRTARLSHPNIVIVHSVEELDDLVLFVMNRINGAPLDQVMLWLPQTAALQANRVPVSIAQSVLLQVAAGLNYAHDEGVVHRDIKPSNVMITIRGEVVITDFGIAKVTAGLPHVKSSLLMGTPTYMSPEQCKGHPVSGASDQYSVGVLAYELLAGSPPFTGTVLDIQNAHVSRAPADLLSRRPGIPRSIAAGIMRMLAKEPSERFPSMEDAARAISEGFNALDSSPRRFLGAAAATARDTGGKSASAAPQTPHSVEPGITPPRSDEAEASQSYAPGLTPVAASISLTAPAVVEVGESFYVAVAPRDASGATLYNVPVSLISENPRVAVVVAEDAFPPPSSELGENGRVRAVSVGRAKLVANGGGARAEKFISVIPAKVASLADRPKRPDPVPPPPSRNWKKIVAVMGVLVSSLIIGSMAVMKATRSGGAAPIESLVSRAATTALAAQAATIGRTRMEADLSASRGADATVRGGRLHVTSPAGVLGDAAWDAHSPDLVAHVALQPEAGNATSGGGFFLYSTEGTSGYFVLVNGAPPLTLRVSSISGGRETDIVPPTAAPSLTQGENLIDVIVLESRLTVYINGSRAASDVTLPRRLSGTVGLYVSKDASYSFRNLALAELVKR